LSGVELRFEVEGNAGQRCVLYTSENLLGWNPLATNQSLTNGIWQFSDPGVAGRPQRFYRAQSGP
jgi:hypothetical protein